MAVETRPRGLRSSDFKEDNSCNCIRISTGNVGMPAARALRSASESLLATGTHRFTSTHQCPGRSSQRGANRPYFQTAGAAASSLLHLSMARLKYPLVAS